jgi:putative ABC transport system permease protein
MLNLIVSAIWRRRAEAAAVFLLGALAGTGAAAAAPYAAASSQRMAVAAVDSAPAAQRTVTTITHAKLTGDAPGILAGFADRVRATTVLTGFDEYAEARVTGQLRDIGVTLAYRDHACAHLSIDGACPTQPDAVIVGSELADRLHVATGDRLQLQVDRVRLALRVTGIYRPRDPREAYWPARHAGSDVLYTPLVTLSGTRSAAELALDRIVTPAAFRRTDPQLLAQTVEQGASRLPSSYGVQQRLRELADRAWADQQLIVVGVGIAAGQLLMLCWFALFLAVRHAAIGRRPDIGLMKMRGARRRDIWALVAGQSALPVALGGTLGLVLGPLIARRLLATAGWPTQQRQVLYATLAATALSVTGGALAAFVAERRSLGESVVELSRRIPPRGSAWRTGIFDVIVVALAVAAVVEVHSGSATTITAAGTGTAGAGTFTRVGIAWFAPVLVAFAIGVIGARLAPVLAAGVAGPALRSSRIGVGLVAVQLARRPTVPRVLALFTLAVVVLSSALMSWDVASQAQRQRAELEVGAARVLTVQAANRQALLAAVRAVDPAGGYAMAVIEAPGALPILAVDSSRLAAVLPWQPGYGLPDWRVVAQRLHPPVPRPFPVSGRALIADLSWTRPAGQPAAASTPQPGLAIRLVDPAGAALTATIGPLRRGRHTYQIPVPGCTGGCRLAGFELTPSPAKSPGSDAQTAPAAGSTTALLAAGSRLVLYRLDQRQPDAAVVSRAEFADRTRWRGQVTGDSQPPVITSDQQGLALTMPDGIVPAGHPVQPAVDVYDAATPLPAVRIGSTLVAGSVGEYRANPFGTDVLPIRFVVQGALAPRLGDEGVLVDLEYADRLATEASGGLAEVWLGPAAPGSAVTALRAHGLVVLGDDSVEAHLRRLRAQGPAVVLRYLLTVSLAGLALALAAFAVVATVERVPRAAEIAALRRQGMRERLLRGVSLGGYGLLVGTALVVGVPTAVVLRSVSTPTLPLFGDDWALLPAPGPRPQPLLLAVGATALVLAFAAGLAAARLARSARRMAGRP